MNLKQGLKNFFIPCLQNQLRPYSLRYKTLVFVMLLSVLVEVLFFVYVNIAFKQNALLSNIISSIQSTVADSLPSVIIEQVNQERLKQGEKVLANNSVLALAARLKALDMVAKGYFSHQGPDGQMAWNWIESVGYDYSYAGENLAVNFFDADDVVDAWMDSPDHRANILNDNFTDIGVAAVRGNYQGKETVFVVQMFASRAAPDASGKSFAGLNEPLAKDILIAKMSTTTLPKATTSEMIAGTSSPNLASNATTSVGNMTGVMPIKKLSYLTRYMVSPRHLARDAFTVLVIYILLVLLIPIYIVFRNHQSSNYWLRAREIYMLFKRPIWSSVVTLSCVGVVVLLNYLWARSGTTIFQAAINHDLGPWNWRR